MEYVKELDVDLRELADGWVLVSGGGEIRDYLRRVSGVFVLTNAQRAEPEQFVMSAPDILDVERYLTDDMGSSIRSRRHLWFVYTPRDEKDMAPGWTAVVDSDGNRHLSDPDGRARAVVYGRNATWFSWLADVPLADIRNSYLDPNGAPLFVDERWHSVWK
ncbi:MAG: TNT antitoxin family protein [Micrococcales bacterium]|nr:TNT antitoxin family protein [Micrococcales bacterium]